VAAGQENAAVRIIIHALDPMEMIQDLMILITKGSKQVHAVRIVEKGGH